tara:strand:- start:1894 stop:2286 length:393 start_codon:yes stop_codon:yes gene_type:complete
MKILGIGNDIINIKRIEDSIKKGKKSFIRRIFTKYEIKYCHSKKNSINFFAKRFAAKEAFSKALGTGIRKGINFKDIEVKNNLRGKPFIVLKGYTRKYLQKKIKNKMYKIHLTLSDDTPWAYATVVITHK